MSHLWLLLALTSAAPPAGDVVVLVADDAMATFVGRGAYEVDARAAARAFLQETGDLFDMLVLASAFPTTLDGGAAYQPVANTTLGINFGQGGRSPEVFDLGADYGSERLQGVILLGAGPYEGGRQGLDVLAQETGHQFAAYARFTSEGEPGPSTELLGREGAHWSFFMDSGGSDLEGNRWEEAGDGRWRTGPVGGGYQPLDLYLMGLIPAASVPPLRYLAEPVVESPGRDPRGRPYSATSLPEEGVVSTGTWITVTIDDILAAEGPRDPPADADGRVLRQGFGLLVREDVAVDADAKQNELDALRVAWGPRFDRATGGLARVITTRDGRDESGPPGDEQGSGPEGGCACAAMPWRWPAWLFIPPRRS